MSGNINTYEGVDIGKIDDWYITESNHRPRGFRFEASRRDGEPSLFGNTMEDLRSEIEYKWFEENEDAVYEAMEGRR